MYLYLLKLEALLFKAALASIIIFINKNSSMLFSIDGLTRADLNLFYANNLYFLWTNIEYIYIYFIPILLLFIQTTLKELSNQSSLLLSSFVLLLTIYITYLVNNLNVTSSVFSMHSNANLLLFNSINKYHPLLLYIVVITILSCTFVSTHSTKIKKCVNSVTRFSDLFIFTSFVILTTMYAGSWWAYQEGSWGGWWAWDSSETFGLIIILGSLILSHFNFFFRKSKFIKESCILIAVSLYVTYIFLQLNFGITSHNFGLKDSEDSLITSTYLFLLSNLFIASCFFYLIFRQNAISNYSYNNTLVFNYYLTTITLPIILSLLPLFTDLVWKSFEVNVANYSSDYFLVSGLTVCITLQWFICSNNFKAISFIVLSLIFISNNTLSIQLLFFFIIHKLSIFNKIHIILLVYLFTSWLSNNYIFNYWIENYSLSNDLLINMELLNYPLSTNSIFTSLRDSTYSLFSSNSTSLSSGFFFLENFNSEYSQLFKSDNNRISLTSKTFDNLTFVLPLLFFMLISYLLASLSSSHIIKC